MGRVLIVDDERSLRDALEVLVEQQGHAVATAASVEEANQKLSDEFYDVVVTDLRLDPDGDGLDVVSAARACAAPPEVIVMTAYGTREKAQQAIARGASNYLEKGPHLATDVEVLVAQAVNTRRLQQDNEQLRKVLFKDHGIDGMVGRSSSMREVFDLVERVASLRTTVLLTGESGTGKERVARGLHFGSKRRDQPFVPVNCGAVPANLIESELFGHQKGAFTGADQDKVGLFQAADGGTIFLDEIGELPTALQPALLRVLQEHKYKPVGGVSEVEVDVRIVAATNRDLEEEVRAGRFREDLFFRLNVIEIALPPLRQRRQDIVPLVQAFLKKYNDEYDRGVNAVAPEAMERLLSFDYPGNIRQLENIIERGIALARDDRLELEQLPKEVQRHASEPSRVMSVAADAPFPEEGVDLERLLADFEQGLIARALEHSGGVKTRAAELLGLTFRQFRYKLAKFEQASNTTEESP